MPTKPRPPRATGASPGESQASQRRFWSDRVSRALVRVGTPCFVFAEEPLADQYHRLGEVFKGLPVRHWWSLKTLPLRPAVTTWQSWGEGVEVVSEYEFRAARRLGFSADDILLNGPAKHSWLKNSRVPWLRVNFDSLQELRELAPRAKDLQWRVGIRVHTQKEQHAEYRGVGTQFGFLPDELPVASTLLARLGLKVEVVHFHLRTQVARVAEYRQAASEVMRYVRNVGWEPAVLDLGGGFPAQGPVDLEGKSFTRHFSIPKVRQLAERLLENHPWVKEIWLENGRWLTAPAGVLAIRILEAKEGRGARTLVCDGGRTQHALLATWERHAIIPLERSRGRLVPTLVCGPTCMAFDNLGLHALPAELGAGDVLLWMDAGAYQLCWETRFSHGLAPIAWCRGRTMEVSRPAETFESWFRRR